VLASFGAVGLSQYPRDEHKFITFQGQVMIGAVTQPVTVSSIVIENEPD
jgi:hypothetical protein